MKKKRINILILVLVVFIISAVVSFAKNAGFSKLMDGYKKVREEGDISQYLHTPIDEGTEEWIFHSTFI